MNNDFLFTKMKAQWIENSKKHFDKKIIDVINTSFKKNFFFRSLFLSYKKQYSQAQFPRTKINNFGIVFSSRSLSLSLSRCLSPFQLFFSFKIFIY